MTYRESDMSQLLAYIISLALEYNNPLISHELLKLASTFIDKVPLYPGIIKASLGNAVNQWTESDALEQGDTVLVEDEGGFSIGVVSERDAEKVVLKKLSSLRFAEREEVPLSRIRYRFDAHRLEDDWPSLIFDAQEVKDEG